tara:strand:+ start:10996 stop:11721 length:726 start_codon:yes stop_codon:yes gene_type:complete
MKYASPEEEWKEVLKTNATAQRFASTLSQLITYRSDCACGAAPQQLFDACKMASNTDGLWLEFGTATGSTAKIIIEAKPPQKHLYTFDCFTGLPEEWHHHHIGAFAQQPPALDTSHATIIEGLFEDTLPSFISEHQEKVAFLHVDCDLYSSTKTIFDNLAEWITKDTIIVFDEFYGYPSFSDHEIKAFDEYVKENGVYYDYVSRAEGCAAACKILFSETAAKAEELRHTKTKINKADEHVL